jgi:hypothetical protein
MEGRERVEDLAWGFERKFEWDLRWGREDYMGVYILTQTYKLGI